MRNVVAKSEIQHSKEQTRNRRAAYFKQMLADLHVTHGEFTDLINKHIRDDAHRLNDSKKISDWISNGIPGNKTTIKARIRQLAVVKALDLERNSLEHKMLVGRLPVTHGLLDTDNLPESSESADKDENSENQEEEAQPARPSYKRRIQLGKSPSTLLIALLLSLFASFSGAFAGLSDWSRKDAARYDSKPIAKDLTNMVTVRSGAFEQCPTRGELPSSPSNVTASLEIKNNRISQKDMKLFWLDFEGRWIKFADLTNEPIRLDTYVGHNWAIKNGSDECYMGAINISGTRTRIVMN